MGSPDVCAGTSSVNAGALRSSSCGHIATPAALQALLLGSVRSDSVYKVSWPSLLADPAGRRFCLQYLRAVWSDRRADTASRFYEQFVPFSIDQTEAVAAAEGIQFFCGDGAVVACADPVPLERAVRAGGEPLTVEELVQAEPVLSGVAPRLCGGVRHAQDKFGSCREFTERLARACTRRFGAKFVLGSAVKSLVIEAGEVVGWVDGDGITQPLEGPVVLCAGCGSERLASGAGVTLPIYPIKGYSITVDVPPGQLAPERLLILEPSHLYATRINDTVRFSSMAELSGWEESCQDPATVEQLRDRIKLWYPGLSEAVDSSEAWVQCGGRPQSADDLPIVSRTQLTNLFVNTGHGQYGWKLACGSAAVLQRVVTGRPVREFEGAPVDAVTVLSLRRFDTFRPR